MMMNRVPQYINATFVFSYDWKLGYTNIVKLCRVEVVLLRSMSNATASRGCQSNGSPTLTSAFGVCVATQ
jgi:hypothetical protein